MTEFNHPYSKKDSPYSVPEGYFAQKQNDLFAIADKKSKKTTSVRLLSWVSGAVAAAVVIALFIFPEKENTQLSSAYVESYIINEYNYGFTEEALLYELNGEELDVEAGWEFSDQAMEEFLDNNFDQTLHYEYY